MKIIMDWGYCGDPDASCTRCAAAFSQKPVGTHRPCVVAVVEDGEDGVLRFVKRTSGETIKIDLMDKTQNGVQAALAQKGWEFLGTLYPSYLRTSAPEQWRTLAAMAAHE